MQQRAILCALHILPSALLFACVASLAHAQALDSVLNHPDKASLDLAALHVAQKIQEAKLTEEPNVLVIDFFRSSAGNSSQLGTLLADYLSDSLSNFSRGFKVLDRNSLKDYFTKNWTSLEDLQSREVCLHFGRELGATGIILGTLYEENGMIALRLHMEGIGPVRRNSDEIGDNDELIRLSLSEQTKDMLFQHGPNYAREPDQIPEESGVLRAGAGGVGMPSCVHCPDAEYSDAARAAKFQGTVVLSIVVTVNGQASSIYVVKGAPFGLTAQTIKTVQGWQFKPALKDGKPVPVRVSLESTFRLF